ncbi:Protein RETICULATA [Hirschfeldia incana]|nr:Protein RETICULATA [Hirschfeldia incana]
MAGCAMNCQFSSAVKLRNNIASLRLRNGDFAFGGLVKEMKVPVLRIKEQRSRLLIVNMSQSPVEPLSNVVVAATEPTKEEGGTILGKGENAGSLGTDEPEKLVVSDGGFNNGGGGGGDGGGGGGGGGEGGEEDYEEKEFGPLLKFEEVMRETEARGATLPSDMLESAKTFGIRKLILLRYLDLQSSAGILGFAIRSWSMLRNRMLADPSFLFKIGTEIVIDSCCATVAEVQKRGKDFWAEFELYVADLLVGVVVNVALVGMLAPFVRFGQPSASSGFLGRMLNAYNALPSSVFEAERPGCSFSAQQRLATYFYKGIMYGAVGFGCGIVGQGIANLIMTAKRSINKSEEDIPVPPLIKSAALWGIYITYFVSSTFILLNP